MTIVDLILGKGARTACPWILGDVLTVPLYLRRWIFRLSTPSVPALSSSSSSEFPVPRSCQVMFLAMKGRVLWGLSLLGPLPGGRGLVRSRLTRDPGFPLSLLGPLPGSHGPISSRPTRDSRSPQSSLGAENTGTISSFLRRSCLASVPCPLGVSSLDKGGSSLFFLGVASGNFIGEINFLALVTRVLDGPGYWFLH